MPTEQGSPELLQDPVAQTMLSSSIPARLSYVAKDGSPRVVPIWFHWTGEELILGTPATAPKVAALRRNPKVALTIDGDAWPHPVLLVRGTAAVEITDSAPEEYAASARRYLGDDAGAGWVDQANSLGMQWARIAIRPHWVGVIDFEQRFPNQIEKAMEAAATASG